MDTSVFTSSTTDTLDFRLELSFKLRKKPFASQTISHFSKYLVCISKHYF